MTTAHVLAIDVGTSGLKAALVADSGAVAARATRPIATQVIPPDGAEQDAEAVWRSLAEAVRELISTSGVRAGDVAAVTCASQYFSVVPVAADGRPAGPMLLWLDSRSGQQSTAIYSKHPAAFPRWLEVHGIPPLPTGADSLSKMLWIQNERREVYEKTRCFLEPADYVLARMSGRFTANVCTAFSMLLTNNNELPALRWDEELVGMSGIDAAKLPELVPPNSVIGEIRPDVAAEMGLAAGTNVISGVNDTQAAAVATATFRPAGGALNAGTTGQVLAHAAGKKGDLAKSLVTMPSPVPGRHMVMAENGIAGRALDHFLRGVVFTDDALAGHARPDPFAGVDALVSSAPAGCGGLLFLPSLTGTVSPDSDPNARGAFINIGLETDRARMVRSIMEGVALSLRGLLEAVEEFTGETYRELRFSGGGARSNAWAQIAADVAGRPVDALADPVHSNNSASALLAFQTLGLATLDDVDRFCPVRQRFEPTAANRGVYDHLSAQMRAAYAALRPVFGALNGPGSPLQGR